MDKYERRRLRLLELKETKCESSNAELSRKLGRDPSYVARMLLPEGKTAKKRIGDDMVDLIASTFQVSRDWIDSGPFNLGAGLKHYEKTSLIVFQVPLISWVRAGTWTDIEDNYLAGQADEWIEPHRSSPGKRSFALEIEGDSMTGGLNGADFPPGSIIIVDPDRAPKAGDYVVAKDVTTQQATFKKLTTDGGRWFLRPLNPAYPTIEIDDPAIRVIGVAVEHRFSRKL